MYFYQTGFVVLIPGAHHDFVNGRYQTFSLAFCPFLPKTTEVCNAPLIHNQQHKCVSRSSLTHLQIIAAKQPQGHVHQQEYDIKSFEVEKVLGEDEARQFDVGVSMILPLRPTAL